MSLEQAIQKNTDAIYALIAQMQSGTATPAATPVAEISKAAVNKAIEESQVAETVVEEVKASSSVEELKQLQEQAQSVTETIAAAPTKQDITAALMNVAKQSRSALLAILNEFGVEKVSEIREADYPAVMKKAEEALGAENA